MFKKFNKIKDKYSKNKIDPRNFKLYKTISLDILTENFYNNRACIFNSFKDDNIYIVYGVNSLNLECFDVIKENKFVIINNIHAKAFDSCRHFFDKINSRDLIITSSFDSHVKITNFKREKSEVIIDLFFDSNYGLIINTAYIINNKIIVPISNKKNGIIELYNMDSELTGKIEDAGFILGLSKFYWKEIKKYFIIIANMEGVLAYNENDLSLYKKFIPSFEKEIIAGFDEAIIIEKNKNLILISPCFYKKYLFFWDFKNGCMISKLKLDSGISDICLWDNNYIFASYNEFIAPKFILINTKYNKIEKKYNKNKYNYNRICGIKVIRHEKKGNFIITSTITGQLNLYKIKKHRKLFMSPIYISTIFLFFLLFIFYILKKYFNLHKYLNYFS